MPEIGQLWKVGCVPYKQSVMVIGVCPLQAFSCGDEGVSLTSDRHGDGVCLEGVEVRK